MPCVGRWVAALQAVDFTERSGVTWTRGPELVETGSGELLGTDAEIRSFAGVTERSGFVLFTAARVTDDGDAVFAADGLDRDGEAVSLLTQFFDSEGAFMVAAQTSLPRLDPDDRFEGYIPNVGDGVAGYAVEAASSKRSIASESPDAVEVVSDAREGDTVSVTVRNASGRLVPFVSLEVTFYDQDGTVLGSQERNVANLEEGERRDYEVVFATPAIDRTDHITDYEVETIQYGGGVRYVR